jgi:hypothetical protein
MREYKCYDHLVEQPKNLLTHTACDDCGGWQVIWLVDRSDGHEVEVTERILSALLNGDVHTALEMADETFMSKLKRQRRRIEKTLADGRSKPGLRGDEMILGQEGDGV